MFRDSLLSLPDWLTLVIFIAIPAAIAVVVHMGVRRIWPPDMLLPHHDVAGFLVSIVGVLYAVVLGFLVGTGWNNFDAAQRNADLEASSVGDLYELAAIEPEPLRSQLQRSIARYAFEVRDHEWPELTQGRQDPVARSELNEIVNVYAGSPAMNQVHRSALKATIIDQAMYARLHDLSDRRRQRLVDATTHMPDAMYTALVLGAMMVIVFVYLFGVSNAWLQFMMTALVAGSIGLVFGLVLELDGTYSGIIHVSSGAWNLIIDNNRMASALPPP